MAYGKIWSGSGTNGPILGDEHAALAAGMAAGAKCAQGAHAAHRECGGRCAWRCGRWARRPDRRPAPRCAHAWSGLRGSACPWRAAASPLRRAPRATPPAPAAAWASGELVGGHGCRRLQALQRRGDEAQRRALGHGLRCPGLLDVGAPLLQRRIVRQGTHHHGAPATAAGPAPGRRRARSPAARTLGTRRRWPAPRRGRSTRLRCAAAARPRRRGTRWWP